MTGIDFLTGPIAQAVGWALVHLIWQGAIVAALLAATLGLLSKQSANVRYAVSCAALALMLLLGVGTAYRAYERPIATTEAAAPKTLAAWTVNAFDVETQPIVTSGTTWRARLLAVTSSARAWLPQIVLAWIVGVALLSARLLSSWLRAHRLATQDAEPATDEWQQVLARLSDALRLRRAVQLLESAAVEVPTVIGWLRPVVLLPASTMVGLSPSQIEMILAHELAHIRRNDFFINLLQAVVETLMFYHPAVWWMSRQVRIERENCCDDLAVAVCGNPLQYARALTKLEELRTAPMQTALAANGGSLLDRVRRLVGARAESSTGASRWLAGVAVLTLLIVVMAAPSLPALAQRDEPKATPATAKVEVAAKAESDETDDVDVDVDEDVDTDVDDDDVDEDTDEDVDDDVDTDGEDIDIDIDLDYPAAPPAPPAPIAVVAPQIHAAVAPVIATSVRVAPRIAAAIAPAAAEAVARAFAFEDMADDDEKGKDRKDKKRNVDRSKKLGANGELTIDELIALSTHGVNADYIREMRSIFGNDLTLGDVLSMKIHGMDADYVREMRAAGLGPLTNEELLSMRIHGMDADYVREMRAANLGDLNSKDLLSMKIHGMDAAYVREMRGADLGPLTTKDLLSMKIHGLDIGYVREMRAAGLGNLTAKDLLQMKIHGVDADYVKALRDAGIKINGAGDVTQLRIHDVDAKFIKQLVAAGYTNLTAREIARLAANGVDAEFIREMAKYRDKN